MYYYPVTLNIFSIVSIIELNIFELWLFKMILYTQRIGISFDSTESVSQFKPEALTPEGNVRLVDFVLFLTKEVSSIAYSIASHT